MIRVTLTSDELWQAVVVGGNRRIACLSKRNTAQHYDDQHGKEWSTEIESCCAELAFAKWMNAYWTGGVFAGHRAEHDAAGRQVRHTTYTSGRLIIYPEDNPDDSFILVTGKAPNYKIVGWLKGSIAQEKGKLHHWWTTPDKKLCPSWWIPQNDLTPMPQTPPKPYTPARTTNDHDGWDPCAEEFVPRGD